MSWEVFLTVYHDAVKTETNDHGRQNMIGWFRDEADAVAAAIERIVFRSSVFAHLRVLPEITIRVKRQPEWCRRKTVNFKRGTRVKHAPEGRRVVRKPNTFNTPWVISREGLQP